MSAAALPDGTGPADSIFTGGRVITMADGQPVVSALAVRNGRISALGDDDYVRSTAWAHTRVIPLGGRTVIPGLIDTHTHLELTAYSRHLWEDVRALPPAEILSRTASIARTSAAGDWIVLQGTFGQHLPSRAEIDSVAPDNPVAIRWTMHKAQLNSCALAVAGLDRRTVAPPGARLGREAGGELTGIIEEAWDLLGWHPPLVDVLRPALAETARELYLRHGVTTVHEVAASTSGMWALQDLANADTPVPRFGVALTAAPGHQPLASARSLARSGFRTGTGDPSFALQALKIFVDGGRDGALRSGNLGQPAEAWGVLTRTPQALAQEVSDAVEAGLQVRIHAIGDLAQECAVNAIEQATRAWPGADHRCRVEHFGNELYDDSRLHRLVAAGGIPAPNPSFVFAEPDDPGRRLPPGVTKYGVRKLLSAGARPPGNSDTAGAQPFACNPWFVMHCMVNRANRNGTVIDPAEAVSPAEALRAFTRDAAYAVRQEHDRGALEVGKLADLVVLSDDPLSVSPSRIGDITAELTILGGETAYETSASR